MAKEITYAITGTTGRKKWARKIIKEALAKGGTGTVFASTDPMHSAINYRYCNHRYHGRNDGSVRRLL